MLTKTDLCESWSGDTELVVDWGNARTLTRDR